MLGTLSECNFSNYTGHTASFYEEFSRERLISELQKSVSTLINIKRYIIVYYLNGNIEFSFYFKDDSFNSGTFTINE